MPNIFSAFLGLCSTGHGSAFFAASNSFLSASFAWTLIKNFAKWAFNLILSLIWIIEKLVLGIMEALEFVINEFLGIGMTINDYASFAADSELSGTLIKTFKAIFVVAIVLMILFTIFAIIRQEWANATADGGMNGEKNKPGPIIMKLFKGVAVSFLLPFVMLIVLGATSSVLTAFNNALKTESSATIAGQVLAVSTYDTNKYRMYANQNKRVPIIISAYNTEDYAADEVSDMVAKIQSSTVQTKLINTATNIEQGMLLSFADSLTYSNNKLTNSSAYGDYYETFICTPEQYQVMADFIDYCQLTNTDFYIKSIDDTNIDWKYVDSSVYSQTDGSLTITYRDATDINGDGSTSDSYTITYSLGYEITSQISNALDSISALLGINEYSDNTYYTMERDENSINVVQWATEKVSIHFSSDFDIEDASTWTETDQILLYEYYHFSANSTLANWTLDDLSYDNRGNATLDASVIVYRDYYSAADAYSEEKEIYCVYINGTYYKTELSETETDDYGNKLYVLMGIDGVNFLSSDYSVLSTTSYNAKIKFSSGDVDLNKSSSWSYTDQIIIYEYYKDLSVSNTFSPYTIYDFVNGVSLPVYTIQENEGTKYYYVLINNTYYQVYNNSGSEYLLYSGSGNFMEQAGSQYYTKYGYEIQLDNTNNSSLYGISTSTADTFITTSTVSLDFDVGDEAPELSLKFSSAFDYRDTETWTFRDYFLFYVYCKYLSSSTLNLDVLKSSELPGDVGKNDSTYYFRINRNYTGGTTVLLKIQEVNQISEEKILTSLDYEQTYKNADGNFDTNDSLLLLNIDDLASTTFYNAEIEYKTFKFSGASSVEVSSWTMQDYILFFLESKGVISVSNTSTFSYNSLVYIYDSNKIYSFVGGNKKVKVYLNETYVLSICENMGCTTIDNFLNMNLMSFVTNYLSSSSSSVSSLLSEESDILAELANSDNIVSNTYNFDEIINLIAQEYTMAVDKDSNDVFEFYDNVQQYTYKNSAFDATDLSTWTEIDFLIYYYTGSASGRYSSYLIDYQNTKYFIISNYAIPYSLLSNANAVATITSEEITKENLDSDSYYTSNLESQVLTVRKDSKDRFDLLRADTYTYQYKYSTSKFQAILNHLRGKKVEIISATNSIYYTTLYTDGTNDYVYVGKDNNNYYLVKASEYGIYPAQISASVEVESAKSANFQKDGTYTSFSSENNYTLLDGIIYYLTDSTTSSTYNCYNYNGNKFVCVDGYYVDYDAAGITKSADSTLGETNLDLLARYLYINYYQSCVSYSVSATGSDNYIYQNNLDVNDTSTWTPMGIVLYGLGLYSDTYASINGTLMEKSATGQKYFAFTENSKQYYINITNFDYSFNSNNLEENNSTAERLLQIRMALLCGGDDGTTIYESGYSVFQQYGSLNSFIETQYVSDMGNVITSYSTEVGDANMSSNNISTWTWLDIAYYKAFGKIREDSSFVVYSDGTYTYLGITNGSAVKFIKFLDSDKYSETVGTGTEDISYYSDSKTISMLGLIYYQNTKNLSGTVSYAKVGESFAVLIEGTTSFFVLVTDLDSGLAYNGSEKQYSYTISSDVAQDVSAWSLLDFAIIAANGLTSATAATYTSYIYSYNNVKYFKTNGYYINLSIIRKNTSPETLSQNDTAQTISCTEKFITMLGYSDETTQTTLFESDVDFNLSQSNLSNFETKGEMYFTDGFDLSDYTTWKYSDFILYYLFMHGCLDTKVKNFQYYVNQGYVDFKTYYAITKNSDGSVNEVQKVYLFGRREPTAINSDHYLINANIWSRLYSISLSSAIIATQSRTVTASSTTTATKLKISSSSEEFNKVSMSASSFCYLISVEDYSKDFAFSDYYYFTYTTDNELYKTLTTGVVNAKSTIDSGIGYTRGLLNLKFSEDFEISDTSKWTVLDFLIALNFSRTDNNNTTFANTTFDELTFDYYSYVYLIDSKYYIVMNGYCYNITDFMKMSDAQGDYRIEINGDYYYITSDYTDDEENNYKLEDMLEIVNILQNGYKYSFRVNTGSTNYNIVSTSTSKVLAKTNTSLVYTLQDSFAKNVLNTYYREVYTNYAGEYQISLATFAVYTVSVMTQEVSWVQKLMNDMQVIYPDLNWANLLATNGWIDTLGEYYSAYASGQYVGSGNSANITAYGLVLSEFLLSISSSSLAGYANYEYSSVFDESTINALMLAILGEEEYETVRLQADIFVEMFNVAFAQVLDDVANTKGIDILDGNVNNLTMSIYKAFLATVLLSSDFGEYIYTIATRVYAQYAIYESLAFAGGDYASYYNYINGYTDENGDTVDAFKYGTFHELVKYENQSLKTGAVPTYTFNYYDVYRELINDEASDTEVENSLNNDVSFANVLSKLNSLYKSKYLESRTCTFEYSDKDSAHYSYMLHVYWSIRQELYRRNQNTPVYLSLYYDYITESGDRRNISMDSSIDAASQYIQNYNLYKLYVQLYTGIFIFDYVKAFYPSLSITIDSNETVTEYLTEISNGTLAIDYSSNAHRLKKIFETSPTFKAKWEEIFTFEYYSFPDVLDKLITLESSVKGDLSSWNQILKMRDTIDDMLEEIGKVTELAVGQKTESGSIKYNYSDDIYSDITNYLSDLSEALNNYISMQQIVDKVEKASITFTLAQYSSNYVESGFEFTIGNSQYTLQTSVSAQRLAEYVYGGKYLESFGVYAQYTSSTFEGAVSTSKVIDDDGYAKTKIYSFTALHEFASSLADYTAKLYFLTNLSDLTENTSDSILLTDYIYAKNTYINTYFGTGNAYATTLEYLILDHIISDEEISADTLLRLVFGETTTTLNGLGCNDEYLVVLAKYLSNSPLDTDDIKKCFNSTTYPGNTTTTNTNGKTIAATLDESFVTTALRRYLVYIQTTTSTDENYGIVVSSNGYGSAGYYGGNNTASDRIHQVFKKVISYLTISEEKTSNSTSIGAEGNYLDFDSQITTFKELKSYLMSSIIDYVQNESETGAENSARYLTLFNLISGEFDYNLVTGIYTTTKPTINSGDYYGTTIGSVYKKYEEQTQIYDLVSYYDPGTGNKYSIYATFQIDSSTRGTILKLCGIENRPIEELVNLEYDSLYETDGNFDEADGDVFVVCSYDAERAVYVPFMATNKSYSGTFSTSSNYYKYYRDYGYHIYTNYYVSSTGASVAYPIIAKGIVTADLRPTAISIQDGVAKFYRTDITVTANISDDAVTKTNASVEVSTVGYIKYVNATAFSNVQASSESKTMYIGSSDIMSYINSDATIDYIQYTNIYNLDKVDDYDGISVLDQFSAFWGMSVQMHFMMILGFITLIPLMFRASGAVLRRVLDLIFLVLIGPLCISMNSLELSEKEHSSYKQWKSYIVKTLLSVFGLVIALNLYYIMVSTTMNMTFVSEGDSTMQKLSKIGGLSFVTASLLNAIIKFIFIIVATNMIEQAGDMLISMVTGGRVDKSFNSPLSGQNAIDSIVSLKNQMVGDISKITTTAKDVATGQILVEAKNALIETLPGSKIVSAAKDKVGSVRNYAKSREMYKKLREKGISRKMAYAASHEFRNNYKKQQKQKRQRREQLAKSFYGRMGMKMG